MQQRRKTIVYSLYPFFPSRESERTAIFDFRAIISGEELDSSDLRYPMRM